MLLFCTFPFLLSSPMTIFFSWSLLSRSSIPVICMHHLCRVSALTRLLPLNLCFSFFLFFLNFPPCKSCSTLQHSPGTRRILVTQALFTADEAVYPLPFPFFSLLIVALFTVHIARLDDSITSFFLDIFPFLVESSFFSINFGCKGGLQRRVFFLSSPPPRLAWCAHALTTHSIVRTEYVLIIRTLVQTFFLLPFIAALTTVVLSFSLLSPPL
ncbi:hypothetical protein B0F90DRAFT_364487 [Multifurca ochricompacta]|uniref:Uncharacterized protein n=1 Tax=Multifurca ochricompacta TaxID=376703 RepID=A0AAD4QHW1_9AGAM|nr:hypothetical protein B0F90DRAFT_364487 [Multifurca ochricompacta]